MIPDSASKLVERRTGTGGKNTRPRTKVSDFYTCAVAGKIRATQLIILAMQPTLIVILMATQPEIIRAMQPSSTMAMQPMVGER